MELEPYERFYYSFQTQGRGLTRPEQLTEAFERFAVSNEELFGRLLPENGSALDIACGHGHMLFYLGKRGLKATGFDLDENQVQLARSIGLDARCADLSALDLREKELDVISAMDVIEHLPKSDAIELLQKIYAGLSDRGILLLRCPCADGFLGAHDVYNDLTHRWGATSVVLRQILQAVGFQRIELIDISVARYPKGLRSKARTLIVKASRSVATVILRLLGMPLPTIWSSSVIALAWK
jgi:SAM-dependent methyltransferase